ncbi:stimulator of interferon genes protein homolog [Phlebotomus argentipes]|uniref:stimulator of interferon genes protein homolog n=1 Tax=Phlebotomus argentipes TaxID=94469 RepID=UPI002893755F|nr:stimulator of interferon genes protein homolog [Phlebotomus argentipes]XP_059608823.1 stimulator of interferon genes protein homolog [Phlebotomus argentipes]XP_059608824.1 stimulator of interferon genes protein homolog [Phlebotomus argentipes]
MLTMPFDSRVSLFLAVAWSREYSGNCLFFRLIAWKPHIFRFQMQGVINLLNSSAISLAFGDILWRGIHFAFETVYHRERYNGILQVAQLVFTRSSWSFSILGLKLFWSFYTGNFGNPCEEIYKPVLFGLLYCFFRWHYEGSPLANMRSLRTLRGLDCGTNMAYSFFHGYLNIILPNRGDANMGLVERIEIFESNEGIEIPVKKLFLLIPNDLYFPPRLSDMSDDIVMIGRLEYTLRDRAGITGRQYTNTVYQLLPQKIYVVAEGATPLLTFLESCRQDEITNSCSREVVAKFHQTLERLLNSVPECRDTFVLIPFSEKTSSGEPTNVAKLLSDAIRKQLYLKAA